MGCVNCNGTRCEVCLRQCKTCGDPIAGGKYCSLSCSRPDDVFDQVSGMLDEMVHEAAVEAGLIPLHHEAVAFALENVDATDEQLRVLEDKCTYLAEAALDAAQGWKTEFEYGIAYAAAGAAVIKFRNEGQGVLDDWLRLGAEHEAACEADAVAHREYQLLRVQNLACAHARTRAEETSEAVLVATLRLNQC